jgi:hypothetical protein
MRMNPAMVRSQVVTIIRRWKINHKSNLQHLLLVQVSLKYLANKIPKEAAKIQDPIIKDPCSFK